MPSVDWSLITLLIAAGVALGGLGIFLMAIFKVKKKSKKEDTTPPPPTQTTNPKPQGPVRFTWSLEPNHPHQLALNGSISEPYPGLTETASEAYNQPQLDSSAPPIPTLSELQQKPPHIPRILPDLEPAPSQAETPSMPGQPPVTPPQKEIIYHDSRGAVSLTRRMQRERHEDYSVNEDTPTMPKIPPIANPVQAPVQTSVQSPEQIPTSTPVPNLEPKSVQKPTSVPVEAVDSVSEQATFQVNVPAVPVVDEKGKEEQPVPVSEPVHVVEHESAPVPEDVGGNINEDDASEPTDDGYGSRQEQECEKHPASTIVAEPDNNADVLAVDNKQSLKPVSSGSHKQQNIACDTEVGNLSITEYPLQIVTTPPVRTDLQEKENVIEDSDVVQGETGISDDDVPDESSSPDNGNTSTDAKHSDNTDVVSFSSAAEGNDDSKSSIEDTASTVPDVTEDNDVLNENDGNGDDSGTPVDDNVHTEVFSDGDNIEPPTPVMGCPDSDSLSIECSELTEMTSEAPDSQLPEESPKPEHKQGLDADTEQQAAHEEQSVDENATFLEVPMFAPCDEQGNGADSPADETPDIHSIGELDCIGEISDAPPSQADSAEIADELSMMQSDIPPILPPEDTLPSQETLVACDESGTGEESSADGADRTEASLIDDGTKELDSEITETNEDEVGIDVEVNIEADTDADSGVDTKNDVAVDTQTDADVYTEADTEVEVDTEVDATTNIGNNRADAEESVSEIQGTEKSLAAEISSTVENTPVVGESPVTEKESLPEFCEQSHESCEQSPESPEQPNAPTQPSSPASPPPDVPTKSTARANVPPIRRQYPESKSKGKKKSGKKKGKSKSKPRDASPQTQPPVPSPDTPPPTPSQDPSDSSQEPPAVSADTALESPASNNSNQTVSDDTMNDVAKDSTAAEKSAAANAVAGDEKSAMREEPSSVAGENKEEKQRKSMSVSILQPIGSFLHRYWIPIALCIFIIIAGVFLMIPSGNPLPDANSIEQGTEQEQMNQPEEPVGEWIEEPPPEEQPEEVIVEESEPEVLTDALPPYQMAIISEQESVSTTEAGLDEKIAAASPADYTNATFYSLSFAIQLESSLGTEYQSIRVLDAATGEDLSATATTALYVYHGCIPDEEYVSQHPVKSSPVISPTNSDEIITCVLVSLEKKKLSDLRVMLVCANCGDGEGKEVLLTGGIRTINTSPTYSIEQCLMKIGDQYYVEEGGSGFGAVLGENKYMTRKLRCISQPLVGSVSGIDPSSTALFGSSSGEVVEMPEGTEMYYAENYVENNPVMEVAIGVQVTSGSYDAAVAVMDGVKPGYYVEGKKVMM